MTRNLTRLTLSFRQYVLSEFERLQSILNFSPMEPCPCEEGVIMVIVNETIWHKSTVAQLPVVWCEGIPQRQTSCYILDGTAVITVTFLGRVGKQAEFFVVDVGEDRCATTAACALCYINL